MIKSKDSWTQIELLHESDRLLKESNIIDSLRNVEWMLCELLKCTRAQLYAYPKKEVPGKVVLALDKMLKRRANYEPLQYILGYTEFYGIPIRVAPGVLIPRPETELLVEHALALLASTKSPTFLDIGTGSGCIALALKKERPDSRVYACDISDQALLIARDNAERLELNLEFFQCDIRQGLPSNFDIPYDLVISNPPYIPQDEKSSLDPEVKNFEPETALFVNHDPLEYYRTITHVAAQALKRQGYLCFETHTDYAGQVAAYVASQGFDDVQVIDDLTSRPRIVIGRR